MIPLDRVREMLAAATPGPWGHYYDEDAGRPCVSCATPTGELCTYLVAEVCSDMVEDAALIAAAPDLARDLLSLADALATAERERDAAQHTADTLGARVTAMEAERVRFEASVYAELRATESERDNARNALDGLTTAVRTEREAATVLGEALAATNRTPTRPGERVERYEAFCVAERAHVAAVNAVAALLSAAPPRSTVEARVVRAYLAAREAVPEGFDADYAGADERARVYALWDAVEVARAALDAALAAAEGTR